MKGKSNYHIWRLGLAGVMLAVVGCSTAAPVPSNRNGTQQASAAPAGPPPRVQDCGIVSIGSPSKYACNGKVYTTFQLAKLRQDWEKRQSDGTR